MRIKATIFQSLFIFTVLFGNCRCKLSENEKEELKHKVLDMFYHGYDSYMKFAFPHDELKPISKSYTNSLAELGNLNLEHLNMEYQGMALTLIDSLSTLAVIGNSSEFERNVWWLADNLSFDVDVRVNLFEVNIRMLGGLLSAHMLARDPRYKLMQGDRQYKGELLGLSYDLGERLLPAFDASPNGIPYAWINFKHGVRKGETTRTNTAAAGSLVLELGLLSRLTGDPRFEEAAVNSLMTLWNMRSNLDLFGTEIDILGPRWVQNVGGIGPSADSFYEYLLKAYILLGDDAYWRMFTKAYNAIQSYYHDNGWYMDADINSGRPVYKQLVSLQAFWPGLQVLAGELYGAYRSFANFAAVWERYGLLPERYLYSASRLHPSENYYPLRPELIESAFYLYQATKEPEVLDMGKVFVESLDLFARVDAGYASIADVSTMVKEDHMHSFFLAETCKYLYLLFDDSFLKQDEFVFTTEGHPIPVLHSIQSQQRYGPVEANLTISKHLPPTTLSPKPTLHLNSHENNPQHQIIFQIETDDQQDDDSNTDSTTTNNKEAIQQIIQMVQKLLAPNLESMVSNFGPQSQQQLNMIKTRESALYPYRGTPPDWGTARSRQTIKVQAVEHMMLNGSMLKKQIIQMVQKLLAPNLESMVSNFGPQSQQQLNMIKTRESALYPYRGTPPDWGTARSGQTALEALVCPNSQFIGQQIYQQVQTLCHVLDRYEDHSCDYNSDCGIDAWSCRQRVCSQAGFCSSKERR
eukprot:TRINITY_DN10939_c1_g1_i6.p1 TRINITY_DN10939_c1_g1~~TRINITY_DN10939_c1_g1_i6.p1  ORF type:complete len:751 (-),score=105.65 TRINITY_DN10939_c1_g1_i6:337-2589(-)